MNTTATLTKPSSPRRWRTLVLAIGTLALVASACGDDDGASGRDGGGGAAQSDLVLGAPPDCEENSYCIPGLVDVYGVDLSANFTPLTPELTVDSLRNGAIDIGVMFTTDPPLADDDLLALEDDQGMFAAENILPVGTQELVDVYGDGLAEVLNSISAELTTDDLIAMNSRYVNDNDDAEDIATDWVADHGLDTGGGDGQDGPGIAIGAQDFGESVVLSEIYRQVLVANGYDASVQEVGGNRELLFSAFESGDVNLAPEYLASELSFLGGTPTSDVDTSYEDLQTLLEERDLAAFEPAEDAANSNVFVMMTDRAEELGITTLSDLADA